MLRKLVAISSAVAFAVAAPALADDDHYDTQESVIQSVLMSDDGFFPEVTYTHAGETLVFFNETESSVIVKALDGSWESDEISASSSKSIRLNSGMGKSFIIKGDEHVVGAFSFEPAPIN